jgi:hypothetical protein
MILHQTQAGRGQWPRNLVIAAVALGLVACAPEDDTMGSRLAQPPAGTPPQTPIDAGDIAIVGQEVAHSIMDLPVVANAAVPPLVQFTGVTSIINPPIDTDPYTQLLRDRLLLLTREKLRFVEHTLPPYVAPGKKGRKPPPTDTSMSPDYEILAEMRGRADREFYKIQVEFVDIHTNEVLFNGLYSFRPEASVEVPREEGPEPTGDSEPPPPPPPDVTTPTTTAPPYGNQTL